MAARFVVTPWRDGAELLRLRDGLFGAGEARSGAVAKVFAWRTRKAQIPLLLEATADLVHVVVQGERRELEHNVLRLLFAAAVSRFVTGVSDTLADLTRLRPSWHPAGHALSIPPYLLETRHRIVHRQMPSLSELKRAAKQSLDWLWEWYWSQLDAAFQGPRPREGEPARSGHEVKGELQAVLKSYVRARKQEIKASLRSKKTQSTQTPPSEAARAAASAYAALSTPSPSQTQPLLLDLLVREKAMLPSHTSDAPPNMDGAFLIWTPLLHQLSTPAPSFLRNLTTHMLDALHAPNVDDSTPTKQGLCSWLVEIAASARWADVRARQARGSEFQFVEAVLAECFCRPAPWSLRAAGLVLEGGDVRDRQKWADVLDAAREGMEGEVGDGDAGTGLEDVSSGGGDKDVAMEVEGGEATGTLGEATVLGGRGPRKKLGMWRPTPIGVVPAGWEQDE